jgi:DNA-binding transcriptional ArsR family regulator
LRRAAFRSTPGWLIMFVRDLSGFEQLDSIAEVIGDAAAIKLSQRFPGRRLYIKNNFQDNDPVVAAIGRDAANLLSEYFSGPLTVPAKPGRNAAIYRLSDKGELTVTEIAETLGLSERVIYLALAKRHKLQTALQGQSVTGMSANALAKTSGLSARLIQRELDAKRQPLLNLFS